MLYGEIIRQHLKIINEHVVADTIDYLEMKFTFQTDDWDGLEKWAHFSKNGTVYDIRLTDDCIRKDDHLNLSAGVWKVYLHGNEFADGKVIERITTCMENLRVYPTGTLDGEPFPEMPASVTEQILARLDNVEQNGGGGGTGVTVKSVIIRETFSAVEGEAAKTIYVLVLKMSDGSEITCTLPEIGITTEDIITVAETDPTGKSFEGHFWFNKVSGSLWVYARTIQTGGVLLPTSYTWYKVGGEEDTTPYAVQYVPQELSAEQQAQARQNIGAAAFVVVDVIEGEDGEYSLDNGWSHADLISIIDTGGVVALRLGLNLLYYAGEFSSLTDALTFEAVLSGKQLRVIVFHDDALSVTTTYMSDIVTKYIQCGTSASTGQMVSAVSFDDIQDYVDRGMRCVAYINYSNGTRREYVYMGLYEGDAHLFISAHANIIYTLKVYRDGTAESSLSNLVPRTRTINGKPLSANITLNAKDVGAVAMVNGVEPDENGNVTVRELPEYTSADEGNSLRIINNAAAWTDGDVRYIASKTLRVGENVLTDDMVTLGTGWSGSLATGFTHTSGNTEPLTFAVGAADGESYLVDGTDSGYNQAAIALSLGDSPTSEPYNGTPTIQWGLTCVGDNGALKIIPAGGYTGKITGLTCRKTSGDGETEVEITLGYIRHTDNPNHLTGFWNIAMGENALGNSVNGTRNIAVGKSSLAALKSGGRNIGLGTYTLSQMEKGENNIAIGADAGLELDESSTNVMIGKSAMYYGKNTECVAIGLNALKGGAATAANGVLAIGTGAGYSGGGTSNVFVGKEAGYKNTGNLNTFVGQQAGVNATSWGCVAIGAQADTQGYSQSIAIGRQAKATKSTQAVFGSDAITETLLKGNLVVRGTDGVKRQIVFNTDGTCTWTEV